MADHILLTRHEMIDALRKIRQLHAPESAKSLGGDSITRICRRCVAVFPCETYRATLRTEGDT